MAKTIELRFDGYYSKEQLPPEGHQCSGVYVVYRLDAVKNTLVELLYIGQSDNTADRVNSSHHKYKDWKKALEKGEELRFSFADTSDEERAESALIYKYKPRLNDTGTESFNCQETTIVTSGRNELLKESFTVLPTDKNK